MNGFSEEPASEAGRGDEPGAGILVDRNEMEVESFWGKGILPATAFGQCKRKAGSFSIFGLWAGGNGKWVWNPYGFSQSYFLKISQYIRYVMGNDIKTDE